MDLIATLKETFEDDIENLGYELVDIEFKTTSEGKTLTFYIYNQKGITIDDCEKVSVYLDEKLDQLDLIKGHYYLEVSSQDLSRPLKTDRDLERNMGEPMRVTMKNGQVFVGFVEEVKEDSLVFDVNDKESLEVEKEDIKQIKIEIVF